MSLTDRLGDAIGAASEASKGIKNVKDKVITITNKGSSNLKKSIKDGASGKKHKLEEDDIRANKRAEAMRQLNKVDESILAEKNIETEMIEGMIIDENRKNFDEIGEFNDTSMIKQVKVGSDINDWLEGIS